MSTKRNVYDGEPLDPRQERGTIHDAKDTGGGTGKVHGPWPQSRGQAKFGNEPGKPWWAK